MIGADHLQNLVVSLVMVLGCIAGLVWLLKRVRGMGQGARRDFEILGATYLGPKEKVVLLKVRNRELLIGLGPNHMCALGEFDSDSAVDKGEEV